MIEYSPPLIEATYIRRYKRFLVDAQLTESKEYVTAHCANTGSMKSCYTEGGRIWLSKHDNPKRKLKYSWELSEVNQTLIGINTSIPNKLVYYALQHDLIPELSGYSSIKAETQWDKSSRLDIEARTHDARCYIEIKNVTLVEEDGVIYFPDAVTKRGLKHLDALMDVIDTGYRAVMFYLVQREDGSHFEPARHIDPDYAAKLIQARAHGVEICCYRALVHPEGIGLGAKVSVVLQ